VDYLVHAGLDGVYVHGSAGEFHEILEWEFDRINEAIALACTAAATSFQIGASHMSAQVSLGRVERSVRLGPSALQVVLPDWNRMSIGESVSFLVRVAERAAGVPLILYNPPQAKTELSPSQYGQLAAAIPSLIGVKVAGGDDSWYRQMREHAGGLAIFVPGHQLAGGMARGAAGAFSNVACLAPRTAGRWGRLMLTDPGAAHEIEVRLQQFIGTHLAPLQADGYANAALDKLLVHAGGWIDIGTRTRWPSHWVPRPLADRVRDAARREIPDLLDCAGVR
jgi:dihydrodipicolinate synthase/N-acetylneuraminate lyase